jgi:BarA-like signal transduction histidine kinase
MVAQLFLILALLIQSKLLDVKHYGTLVISVAKTLRRRTHQRLILANISSMSMNVLLRTPSS